jgi:hypothetical protein
MGEVFCVKGKDLCSASQMGSQYDDYRDDDDDDDDNNNNNNNSAGEL